MLSLMLMLEWRGLLGDAVVLELGRVGSVVAVVAGQVCLFVRAAPALLCGVIVRAANLTKCRSARVRLAAKNR